MTRSEYFEQLKWKLRDVDQKISGEVLLELETHFIAGQASGKDDDEIIAGLGSAAAVAAEIRNECHCADPGSSPEQQPEHLQTVEEQHDWGWRGSRMLPDELVRKIQQSPKPLVSSYEDIVFHSSKLSREMINELALQYVDTIQQFEEICYLDSYLSQDTLNTLCMRHKEKFDISEDLQHFVELVSPEVLSKLIDYQTAHDAGGKNAAQVTDGMTGKYAAASGIRQHDGCNRYPAANVDSLIIRAGVCRVSIRAAQDEQIVVQSGECAKIFAASDGNTLTLDLSGSDLTGEVKISVPSTKTVNLRIEGGEGGITVSGIKLGELYLESDDADQEVSGASCERLEIHNADGETSISGISCGSALIKSSDGSVDVAGSSIGSLEIGSEDGELSISGINCQNLIVHATDGSLDISGSSLEKLDADVADGEIDLRGGSCTQATLKCGDGNVSITALEAGELKLELDSGNATVTDSHFDKLAINAGDGDVEISGCHGGCRIEAGDGNVTAENCHGMVEIIADDGDIQIERCVGELKLRSSDGNIRIALQEITAPLYAESDDGDLILRVDNPPQKPALDLRTDDGKITSRWPSISGKLRSGRINGDSPLVTLVSGDGDIKLR